MGLQSNSFTSRDTALLLQRQGWLSLRSFVIYLKQYHPERYISYPTATRLLNKKRLRCIKVGETFRIYRDEIERYLKEGNYHADDDAIPQALADTARRQIPISLIRRRNDD